MTFHGHFTKIALTVQGNVFVIWPIVKLDSFDSYIPKMYRIQYISRLHVMQYINVFVAGNKNILLEEFCL